MVVFVFGKREMNEFVFGEVYPWFVLTWSGCVKSFEGRTGSAGKSFSTKLVVFMRMIPRTRSHTAYIF